MIFAGLGALKSTQNKSTDCAPEGFSPKAHYLFDSEIELVWELGQSQWWESQSQGRVGCVCVVLEIYVYTICDLSGTCAAAAALWNLTRNTLFIPLGRPSIKTWRIGYLLAQTVIHAPLGVCVCVLLNPNIGIVGDHTYCRGCTHKHCMH